MVEQQQKLSKGISHIAHVTAVCNEAPASPKDDKPAQKLTCPPLKRKRATEVPAEVCEAGKTIMAKWGFTTISKLPPSKLPPQPGIT